MSTLLELPMLLEAGAADRAGRLGDLRAWFGIDFLLLDGTTGEFLSDTLDSAARERFGDWPVWSTMCRAVAQSRRPTILSEDDLIHVLAIPLPASGGASAVAVGLFPALPPSANADFTRLARRWETSTEALADWAGRQPGYWSPVALEHTAELALTQWSSRRKLARTRSDVDKLSEHLADTYEEISLIHRLAQSLRLSSTDEDLARLALKWLDEALAVECLAVQLLPQAEGIAPTDEFRSSATLLTIGNCPLSDGDFGHMVEHLCRDLPKQPIVLNPPCTTDAAWPFAGVRNVILVPLVEGERLFGWLAAFNHREGRELGTVEGSLLGSVAAILTIHGSNADLYRQQAELLVGMVRALTSAIDAKDPYTCGHSDRVARVAVRLAKELGCSRDQLKWIYFSGLLHDVGKIGIDESVLRKPGRLTPAEYEHIQTHTTIGHRILRGIRQLDDVLPAVLHHHESWDGRGYPSGLSGESIPWLARIVGVADAFDAMASDRPYRPGMPDDKLDEILRDGAGKQWDEQVVAAFFNAREDIRAISCEQTEQVCLDPKQWA